MRPALLPPFSPSSPRLTRALALLARSVSMRKGRGPERIARIVDSPSMPEADAKFQITAQGITDVSDGKADADEDE